MSLTKIEIEKLTVTVAMLLMSHDWMLQAMREPSMTYVPPTEEQAIWEYRHVPFFSRSVQAFVNHIRNMIDKRDDSRCSLCGGKDSDCPVCIMVDEH